MIGEALGELGNHRVEEMEQYEESLQIKTEAYGENQNDESIADTLVSLCFDNS